MMDSTLRVCDLMHKGIVSCRTDDTARDVARMMSDNQLRSVVVVNERGEVWGLITYMEMIPLYGKRLSEVKAKDIMLPYRFEIDPQASIAEAIALMRKMKYYHLIIVDPHVGTRWPVGMLTSFDVVLCMARLEVGRYEQLLKLSDERRGLDSHG